MLRIDNRSLQHNSSRLSSQYYHQDRSVSFFRESDSYHVKQLQCRAPVDVFRANVRDSALLQHFIHHELLSLDWLPDTESACFQVPRARRKCQSHQSCRSSSRWSNTQSMSHARAPRPSSLSVSRTILKSSASSDDRTNDIWVVLRVTNACIVSRVVKALVRSLVTDHGAKAVAILPLQIPAHCVFCLL